MALNDEAHHCYREKPNHDNDDDLSGDEKKEAEKTTKQPGSGYPVWRLSIASRG